MKFYKKSFYFLFLLVTIIFSYYFCELRFSLIFFQNHKYHAITLQLLLDNSASVPFQYRVLIPYLVRSISNFGFSPFQLFKVIEFISIFSLVIAFYHYILLFFKNKILSAFLSLSLLYVLPFNFLLPRILSFWYPWDMPSILFFVIGLILIYKKKWIFYYPVFIVATFNRETTLFLVFIYFVVFWGREKLKIIISHCFAQLILWIGIKYILYNAYSDNIGAGLFENHLLDNIRFLMNIKNYPLLLSNMGFIWIPTIFYFGLIKDIFVKRSLLVIFPFCACMIYVGNIGEMRIYGEIIPVVLSAFLLILKEGIHQLDNKLKK